MSKQLEPAEAPPEELLRKAGELLENARMVDIRPFSIRAELNEGVSPGSHVSSVGIRLSVSYAIDEGQYGNRFDYSFELMGDAADERLGSVEFSLLIDYELSEGFEPDPEAADYVAATTGHFAAYPYARELFQSLSARLQFDPVVLGLIRRGSLRPGGMNLPVRSHEGDGNTE